MTEIVVPPLGESVTEATVAKWLKAEGDAVAADETIAELETDKVTVEVTAPEDGVLEKINVAEGNTAGVGDVLGAVKAGAAAKKSEEKSSEPEKKSEPKPEEKPAEDKTEKPQEKTNAAPSDGGNSDQPLSPAVRKLIEENRLDPSKINGTGKDGRILKGDVLTAIESGHASTSASAVFAPTGPCEERVKMSRLRLRIAERLKEAQNTAAMLTTFNEVDMSAVMALRKRYKEKFEKKHEARLGFMSFFVKAAIQALKEFPAVNAEIDGDEIVYKHYYDIGVAVSTPNGLVVPVIRDADQQTYADIENGIVDAAKRAVAGKLGLDEMTGGTFTITNGGVFGSMLSTPILNTPQVGILGMHNITQRPVVVNGEITIRPMMYVAMSYDHRIIDGREAVSFLYRIKEAIEDPERLLLDV